MNNGRTDVIAAAQGRWPGVLTHFGVDEKTVSGKHCPCPMCGGKDRFRVISKEGPLRWICNQCGSGDGMDLLMQFLKVDFKTAAERVKPMVYQVRYAPPQKQKSRQEKRKIMAELTKLWKEADPQHDVLHEYLQYRGLRPEEYAGADLRLHPELPYYDDEGNMTGKLPCMLARIADRSGKLACLHRTYLHKSAEDWMTKKKISKVAREWAGGGIRLFGTKDADTLIVTEGIETALSMRAIWRRRAVKLAPPPVWAMVSANNLERAAIPEHIKTVIIGGDNDATFTGQKAAYTLANHLHLAGDRIVRVSIPQTVGDWNDVLKEGQA